VLTQNKIVEQDKREAWKLQKQSKEADNVAQSAEYMKDNGAEQVIKTNKSMAQLRLEQCCRPCVSVAGWQQGSHRRCYPLPCCLWRRRHRCLLPPHCAVQPLDPL
jgi:hypothetical protein